MSQRLVLALAAACVGFLAQIAAQDPPERERIFCDAGDPRHRCPGPDCACVDDTLEVTFDGASSSVLEYARFVPDAPIDTAIVCDTKTPGIVGWSFAVQHDDAFLALLDATFEGTAAERARTGGFAVVRMDDIEACRSRGASCRDPVPAAGYFSAVVLSFTEAAALPLERNRLCVARYALTGDPGPNGTLVQIVHDRLGLKGGPPVAVNLSLESKSRQPSRLVDGWIKAAGDPDHEVCGDGLDNEGDGQIDYDDPECLDVPSCCSEVCSNSRDDDGDALADCADRDCLGVDPCGPRFEDCWSSQDDDGDGLADCADPDCFAAEPCVGVPEVCDNGLDDDHDGVLDCDDLECAESVVCPPRPERCSGFRDEDRDGLVDCQDPDCVADEECLPGPERRRVYCDAADAANGCPGTDCRCLADTLEVTFDGQADSVFQYETFVGGTEIQTAIVTDTRSSPVQGWSYGVEHDASYLTLLEATVAGTDAEIALRGGFAVVDMDHVEVCPAGDPHCRNPVPGSGYVTAIILAFLHPEQLPIGRNTICRARYTLAADTGPNGTLVRVVSDRLRQKNSPPVSINLTVDGNSRAPVRLVDGWVKAAGEAAGGPGGACKPGSSAATRTGTAGSMSSTPSP